jgi:hypothetical protein
MSHVPTFAGIPTEYLFVAGTVAISAAAGYGFFVKFVPFLKENKDRKIREFALSRMQSKSNFLEMTGDVAQVALERIRHRGGDCLRVVAEKKSGDLVIQDEVFDIDPRDVFFRTSSGAVFLMDTKLADKYAAVAVEFVGGQLMAIGKHSS